MATSLLLPLTSAQGAKVRLFWCQMRELKNKSFGVGRVGEPHVGEIFLPQPLPPANSRRRAAFSEGSFKVAPVQPGVGVTEGLMWAQSAL